MKKLILFIFLLLLSSSAFGMGEKVDQTENGTPIYNSAEQQFLYAKKTLVQATNQRTTENVNKAVFANYDFRKLFPNENKMVAETYFLEAKSYLLLKNYSKGMSLLEKFTELDQNKEFPWLLAESLFLKGKILQDQQKYEDAITAYNFVIKEYPAQIDQLIESKENIAECYLALGKNEESIDVLEDLLNNFSLKPYLQANSLLKIGLAYNKLGDYTNAVTYLKKVLSMPATSAVKGPQTAAKLTLPVLEEKVKKEEAIKEKKRKATDPGI